MNVNLETTPCVFAHPKLHNLFYCDRHPQGMTQNMGEANRYVGAQARMEGVADMIKKFPKIKPGQVVFNYIVS